MPNFGDITGLAVAGFSIFVLWKIVGNHIAHNTEALNKLELVITRLSDLLEREK